MFRFIKKAFLVGLTVLSYLNLLSTNQLSCISMTNQVCKVRPQIVNVDSKGPYFILLVLKQVNAVVVVTTSMIHTQK